ncbi:MAG: dUTP diphosphatase, partial [Oscillospiraceae bacterium]|nr:dUTP diphosphatase [Oscillospiraceae bacterium]
MALVQVKKLKSQATLPTSGSRYAAGYDLYACLDGDGEVTIPAHRTVKIGTGLAVALPEGTFGAIFARSGLATKEGLRPANCVGVIDSDYRGECIVSVHNDSGVERTVRTGERIAQLVLLPFLPMEFEEVDALEDTERGA